MKRLVMWGNRLGKTTMIKEGRVPGGHGLGTKAEGPGHRESDESERCATGDRARDSSPDSSSGTHILTERPLVSILCPSRGRPDSFQDFQATLCNVADDVELLVARDFDDTTTYRLERFARCFTRKRDWLTRRVNELALNATGNFLMWGNDDMRFGGPEWIDLLAKFDPGVPAVIGFSAGQHRGKHFPFPILTREGYRRQGFFAPEQFRGVYADTWLYDVGQRAGRLYYNPNYHIEHLHWSDDTRSMDEIDRDKSMRGTAADRSLFAATAEERQEIANKFAAAD